MNIPSGATMPPDIRELITDLLNRGIEVWLIGSHANPTNSAPNDWDFVICGTRSLLEELSQKTPIPLLDALVVVDGDSFMSPWPRPKDGVIKRGSLDKWKWKQLSSTSATYEGTKLPNDWGTTRNAIRMHL